MGGVVSDGGSFEVDIDELHARGTAMLTAGDAVEVTANRGCLGGSQWYGNGALHWAAGRFVDRYTYLLRGVGEALVDEGHDMRGSAFFYEEADAMAAAQQNGIGMDWP